MALRCGYFAQTAALPHGGRFATIDGDRLLLALAAGPEETAAALVGVVDVVAVGRQDVAGTGLVAVRFQRVGLVGVGAAAVNTVLLRSGQVHVLFVF